MQFALNLIFYAVEAKNCLDSPSGRDVHLNPFVKPPANLVVLEGDCLDTTGDAGELESYLVHIFFHLLIILVSSKTVLNAS